VPSALPSSRRIPIVSNKRILAHLSTDDDSRVAYFPQNKSSQAQNNSYLGRVPLKIPAGQDRGRPARDGLARRLAPDDRLAALPLGGLGLGPGHGGGGGEVFAVRSKEVGGGFGSFPLALTFDMLCFLEV